MSACGEQSGSVTNPPLDRSASGWRHRQQLRGDMADSHASKSAAVRCTNSYGNETRPSSSDVSVESFAPAGTVTAKRGPALRTSYGRSWRVSVIDKRRTYWRGRKGKCENRHSTAPVPT